MPTRLSRIDDLTRPDHTFLSPDDECYYLGDYTARKGFAFSETNNLVNNLRKPMDRRHLPESKSKEAAIKTCGRMLRQALDLEWLRRATLVPIPSSKTRDQPDYDDRLDRVLAELSHGERFDVRDLVVMLRSVPQSHLAAERVSIEELVHNMTINSNVTKPQPSAIAVFDDVITTGRHFKAVQRLLAGSFPATPIVGLFIAPQSARQLPLIK